MLLDLALREATPRPNSWNAEQRTIEAVIASSAPVARRDANGDYLEISTRKAPILAA